MMSDLSYGYPPEPLSYYGDHSRFDYYYKREDRAPKKGQPWDLFNSWGQQRLLLKRENGETKAESNRLAMNYQATSCTVPTMPPNALKGSSEFTNPALQILQEQRELARMKEAILYRIPMAQHKGKKYGDEVRIVGKMGKKLLQQMKKQRRLSEHSSSSSDEEDDNSQSEHEKKRSKSDSSQTDEGDEVEDSTEVTSSSLAKEVRNFTEEHSLVQKVLCDFHKDPRLFSDIRVPMLPTDYLGGCLSSSHMEERSYLAHATGPHLSRVAIKQVHKGDLFSEMSPLGIFDNDESVRQVAVQCYSSQLMFSTRSSSKMTMCNAESEVTVRDVVLKPDIRHLSLSPYFPEALFVQDHNIYRWNENGQSELLFSDWSTRFPVVEATETVHYACHPRQLIMTDPTVCSLYDTRSRSVVELFEIPSNTLLHQDERLVTSIQAKDFSHHILAHHTLLTIDERFTKYPVLYQMIPCLAWPMLMNTTHLDDTTDLLTIGCPTNQETFAMVLDNSNSIFKSTPIWLCSRPSDISHFSETKPPVTDRRVVDGRLTAGLLGLTASKFNKERFTVHMLSGQGDLFEQTYTYGIDSDLTDRTKAAGPVLDAPSSIPAEVSARCRLWYDAVVGQQTEDTEDEVLSQVIVVPKDGLIPAHQSCSVCNRQCDVTVNSTGDDFQCQACGLTLTQSKDFIEKTQQGMYYDYGTSESADPFILTEFNPQEQAAKDANSNLLLKLWNDEDIKDDLAERNKQWDERREKSAVHHDVDGALGASELDALTSVSGATKRTKSVGAKSISGASNFSRNKKDLRSLPGFVSPRRRFQGGSEVSPHHDIHMQTPALTGGLWMSDSPSFQLSASQATPSSQRKGKGRQTKGF